MNARTLNVAQVNRLQQAADWFIRLKENPTDAVITAWMEWCETDPQNLTAFEEIKGVWMASEAADDAADAMVSEAAGATSARPTGRVRRLHRFAPQMLAAGVAALVVAASALFYAYRSGPPKQVFSTPVAMHSDSVLEDGSHLALGALSRVSTQFSAHERLIVMESGEAFFTVAKDSNRPFVVRAGPVSVTALGTAFNVRRSVERIIVTVTEGRVGVATDDRQPVEVDAGQQISYSHAEHRFAVAPADSLLASAWQRGVFKYVREPLVDVIADLNRYRTRRIVIEDAALGEERYTGTVFGSRMDDWLEALQSAFPVRVVETPDTVVLTRRDRDGAKNPDVAIRPQS